MRQETMVIATMVLARLGPSIGNDEDGEQQARNGEDQVHRPHDRDIESTPPTKAATSPSDDADSDRHHAPPRGR